MEYPKLPASDILTPDCVKFLIELSNTFEYHRQKLLTLRCSIQQKINNGSLPKQHFNDKDWKIKTIPEKLKDRTIEITGPVDRKMIINALNSNANGYMADFEDSTSPTWKNIIEGQINLRDAINNNISFDNGRKIYKLKDNITNLTTLFVRPRGLHLNEKNVTINNIPISASFFDFGVYFFTNAKRLSSLQIGPYFYLPKL